VNDIVEFGKLKSRLNEVKNGREGKTGAGKKINFVLLRRERKAGSSRKTSVITGEFTRVERTQSRGEEVRVGERGRAKKPPYTTFGVTIIAKRKALRRERGKKGESERKKKREGRKKNRAPQEGGRVYGRGKSG